MFSWMYDFPKTYLPDRSASSVNGLTHIFVNGVGVGGVQAEKMRVDQLAR